MNKQAANGHSIDILSKVPAVTLVFWIIKVLATTVGETAADLLNIDMNFGLMGTSVIMTAFLMAFLLMQFRARRYIPWLYWMNVVFISIVGTLITDNLVDNLGVSLGTTTAVFSAALIATFVVWYRYEKTLSIQSITTTRREFFYWAAVLFTFALGTAAGDLTAEGISLGYAYSALLFAAMIATVTAVYYLLKANAIASFWIIYILTRPLGASCGDYFSQSVRDGGLGLGSVVTSFSFLAAIVILVTYLTITRRDALDKPVTEAA